jgi:integrase
MDACLVWAKNKPGTRIGYHVGIRHWIEYMAASANLLAAIPHVTSPDSPTRVVGGREFESVLTVAQPGLALCMLLCRDAALRAATAYRLTSQHIDGMHIRSKTKWDGAIVVPMSARLSMLVRAAVSRAKYPDTPLVCALGVPETRWTGSALRHQLKAAQKRVGAGDWTWHDLRRTAAQDLYRMTGDLRRVQVLLGHRSLLATLHYLNATREAIMPADVNLFASIPENGQESNHD